MRGDQARVLTIRNEYWDLAFELGRPREAEAVEWDRRRLTEIVEELARLGADVGPQPACRLRCGDQPKLAWNARPCSGSRGHNREVRIDATNDNEPEMPGP